jgi:osomolarity two-component system sensor histidine kinase NIK1
MYTAEDALTSIKNSEAWQSYGPETKKRRSVGDTPPITSFFSSQKDNFPSSFTQPINVKAANGPRGSFFSSQSDSITNSTDATTDVDMLAGDPTVGVADVDRTARPISSRVQNMSLSLDNIPNNFDPSKLQRTYSNGSNSAPSTSHIDSMTCPTCGKTITDTMTLSRINGAFSGSPGGSPLVVPPGPLAAAAFESGMSAVEELRLLKAQVQDVARVCNAVARGDLSQKITVHVQGVVMVQLKDVINTMVS